MRTIVYCEATHRHACVLIARARAFSGYILALCETEADCAACFAAGADEAAVLGVTEDDCTQAERIALAIGELGADSVLFPATVRGRFLSAWVAARLGTGLTADCTDLGVTPDGLLLQTRPAFGGNLMADILCRDARPQMASVRPGVFSMPDGAAGADGLIRRLAIGVPEGRMRRVAFTPAGEGLALQDAPVIVAGGKGVGSRRGFAKLFTLAALLHGAVGATRSAVDAGYISYAHQIGQTGVNVRPRLYIAFAVSGAVQHVVGMRGAQHVIAVNRDRHAPIFAQADEGIVADWEAAADEMIATLRARNP